MTRKQRRLSLIALALAVLGTAAGLVLFALNDSIVFFYGPTDVVEKAIKPGTRFRIGGLVKEGSIQRGPDQTVRFEVTDTNRAVPVTYQGLLPDLFRDGQGVVAEGALQPSGEFRADSVLAKHDENYMPKEVAEALKKQGVWQPSAASAGSAAKPASAEAKPGS
ncbi:cytochrome c maturation protein CcmE [Alsobacter sp. KACC 23698]|uniref:Cytochrome c-type biogenesis protein CcmE n=1 Tax=Alsobacter sp. KACC 23698 TaxID=3149229 RepID=A0AAU7JI00_9HYPH